MYTLIPQLAAEYTLIENKQSPEWGTWRMNRDRNGWVITGDRGSRMLFESEFHFWNVVSIDVEVIEPTDLEAINGAANASES